MSAGPIVRSYWVRDGQLMAGPYPGSIDTMEAHDKLRLLLDAGVRAFLDLTEDDETNLTGQLVLRYQELLRAIAEERGDSVYALRFPYLDMSVPESAFMVDILDAIDDHIAAGRVVYVHCRGGLGRTGTVVGCWLARHGHAVGDEALDTIQRLRQGDEHWLPDSPQTFEQCDFVRTWPCGR